MAYDYMLYDVCRPVESPECIIGQISWNSGGRILIKKVDFEIEGTG